MFNKAAYNRASFNAPSVVFVYGQIIINGIGSIVVTGNVEASPEITLDGVGELQADAIRELYFTVTMDGIGELQADAIRERFSSIVFDGQGSMTVNASRFHVDFIEFTGDFIPGDRIIIDSKNLKMTLNGANALQYMQGDFFDLNLGSNELVYTDADSERSVLIRFTHRDKFI